VVVAYIRRTSFVTKYNFTAIKGGKPHFSDSSGYCTSVKLCAAGRVLLEWALCSYVSQVL